jgi:hypothetical protein
MNDTPIWSTIADVLTGDRAITQPRTAPKATTTRSPAPQSRQRYQGLSAVFQDDRPVLLDVEETPLRPIKGSIYYSHQLAEIREWSAEANDAIDLLARDCFTSDDGEVGSWQIAGLKEGIERDSPRAKLNPKLLSLYREVSQRRCGKDLVIGGDKLMLGVDQALTYGDSFLQIRLEREGMSGGTKDWGIAESMYMPPLSMFVMPDAVGREASYRQYFPDSKAHQDYHLLEILHFSYKKRGLYGRGLYLSRIESWERLKRLASKVEDALSSCGVSPWLHILPRETPSSDVELYKQKLNNLESQGIIKSLVLLEGSDVRKAANNDAGLAEILEYWLQLRQCFIPLGMPDYFFSSLPNSVKSNRDLGLAPAALYARTRAANQAIAGQQAKWAMDIEIILKFGYDFWKRNPYEIVWPRWEISPTQHIQVEKEKPQQKQAEAKVSEKEEALTRDLEAAIARRML